jgi:hypothetical protein
LSSFTTTFTPGPNKTLSAMPVADANTSAILLRKVKENLDQLAGFSGSTMDRAVTFNDLVGLGVITAPNQGGSTETVPLTEAQADARYLALTGGTLTGDLNIKAANATVAGNVTASWLHSTGDVTASGNVTASGGTFYTAGSTYYLQRSNTDGYWRFVENGNVTFQIDPAGNAWAAAALTTAYVHSTGNAQIDGAATVNGSVTAASMQTTSNQNANALVLNSGGNLRLLNTSGVSMYIRPNAASPWGLEVVNNAYNAVVASLDDGGHLWTNNGISTPNDIHTAGSLYSQQSGNYGNVFLGNGNALVQGDPSGNINLINSGTIRFQVTSGGDTQANGNVFAGSGVYVGRNVVGDCFITADSANHYWNFGSGGWKLLWAVSNGSLAFFNGGGGALFQIDGNGNLWVPGTVTGSNVSDARTKRAVAPFRRGLADIVALEPVSYEYNGLGGTTDDGRTRWGVVAQDAQKHIPECVHATPEPPADPTRDEAPEKLRLDGQLSFNEQPLLYAMVNALREISARLETLEARLAGMAS